MRSLALANFLASRPYRRFAIVNQDYAYGHDAGEGFKRRVKQIIPDAQVVAEEYHPTATKDFGPFISKVIAAKPELIFSANWGVDLVNLMKQARDMGVKTPFMSYNLHDPSQVLPVVKEDAIGSFTIGSYMETVDSTLSKDFLQRWSKKANYVSFEKWPAFSIGQSYNGMRFLVEAIRKAGAFNVPDIIKAWEGLKIEGLAGPMIMRAEDHQTLMPVVVAEIVPTTNEFFPFPYVGKPYILPIEKTTVPLQETGCNRKKGEL